MTKDRNFKRRVRDRMEKTGESYASARSRVEKRPKTYPFDSFTAHAKKALQYAQAEAEGGEQGYVGSEHLLLGLLLEKEGIAALALRKLGVDATTVRTLVDAAAGSRERRPGLLPAEDVKAAIEAAFAEAERMGHDYVGTEHLLLALLSQPGSVAGEVLTGLGVSPEGARHEVDALLVGAGGGWREWAAGSSYEPPYNPDVVMVLRSAITAAREEQAPEVRLDHLAGALVKRPRLLELMGARAEGLAALVPSEELREAGRRLVESRAAVAEARRSGRLDWYQQVVEEQREAELTYEAALRRWLAPGAG